MLRRVYTLPTAIALLTATIVAAGPWTVRAEENSTTLLVVHPADVPKPALKYQLLPTLLDRKPGNAAVIYCKLIGELEDVGDALDSDRAELLTMPLDELPRDKIRNLTDGYLLREIERASRMNHCDWQLPLGEQDSFSILLPELMPMRTAGRMLALRARLEIADGDFDAALATVQTGYALAKHVGEEPTMVSHLVGITISNMMTDRLIELVQQPGAPNLYWAVASLGPDWIDARPAMETERFALDLTFAWWGELDSGDLSKQAWAARFDDLVQQATLWIDDSDLPWTMRNATVVGVSAYPRAKQYLIDAGRTAADVEAMPVGQVLSIYSISTFRELHDDVFKWVHLPFWQVHAQLEDSIRRADESSAEREIVPLARLLISAVGAFSEVRATHQRSLDMLRAIEAIRLYGAAHESQLPEQLSDITEVPLPFDPTSGQAFRYHLSNGQAILESPPPPGSRRRNQGVRYAISFAR